MRAVCTLTILATFVANPTAAHDIVSRWTATQFDGGGIQRGDPITLFWSIVPDGESYERSASSNLIDYLDDGWNVPLQDRKPILTNRPWWTAMKSAYDQYERVSGIRMAYRSEQNAFGQDSGLQGDIRIGGEVIDQDPGGVLADNTFPNAGDMRIDTSRETNGVPSSFHTNEAGLRNLIGHESGHGVGLGHSDISGADALMEGGLQTHFFGLQFDDVYGFNRLYGDPKEKNGGNDSLATGLYLGAFSTHSLSSVSLGTHAIDSVVEQFDDDWLGIDGATDEDWFRFNISGTAVADIAVTPVGPTYMLSGQAFEATKQSNLKFEVYKSDGSLLRTVDNGALGVAERLRSQTFAEPGDYFVRVLGEQDENQFYQIDVSVQLTDLLLTVNRDTGEMSMSGLGATGVGIDGYRIESPSGSLNPANGAWRSLEDQGILDWREASPTSTSVQELLPTGTYQLSGSDSIHLGNFYSQVLTAPFGTVEEGDIMFSYLAPGTDDVWLKGAVEFTGDPFFNNLVLAVDPSTGHATLANESDTTIQFDGYSISSDSGALSLEGWASLADQMAPNWRESNPSSNVLSELNPTTATMLAPGEFLNLGRLFDVLGMQDLELYFLLDGDAAFRSGVVTYEVQLAGDYDRDGDVDADDYLTWKQSFGSTVLLSADGNRDGVVDAADYSVWRDHLSPSASFNGPAGASPVPEPCSINLVLAMLLGVSCVFRRRPVARKLVQSNLLCESQ